MVINWSIIIVYFVKVVGKYVARDATWVMIIKCLFKVGHLLVKNIIIQCVFMEFECVFLFGGTHYCTLLICQSLWS